MARLGDHPNIVTVFDAVDDAGVLHIVVRYMAGGSLAERLATVPAGGSSPPRSCARAGRSPTRSPTPTPTAVVHRDVKPDNVWLGADGSAGLGDFGIAMVTGDRARQRRVAPPGRRTTRRPSRAPGPRRCRSPTSMRSARRCGSCCAGGRRSPAPTPSRCSRSTATRSPSRPRATRRGSRPGSTRSCSSLLAKRAGGPAGGRGRRARRARPAGRRPARPRRRASRPTASRSSGASRSWRSCAARSARREAGRAGVVAIAGEPGIGKSRLVDEAVAESAARGAAVVRGRADEESRAYGPWRAALRPLAAAASGLPAGVLDDVRRLTGDGRPPELPAAGEPADAGGEETRLRMFDAVAALVRAAARERLVCRRARGRPRRRPLVARAAGPRRGRLPGRAAARPADVPRGGGRREPSAGAGPRRARARPLADPDRAARPARGGRRPAAAARHGRRARRAPRAARADGGQPVLPARAAADARRPRRARRRRAAPPLLVPDRVREVVAQRLEPLAPSTREVLAIAGVVGRPFTIAGVARVGGLPRETVAEALEPALAGRLVEARPDSPGRFGFAHAIVRDAVYDELAPAQRARAARRGRRPAPGVARRRRRRDGRRGRAPRARRGALRRRPAAGLGAVAGGGARGGRRCRRTPRPPRTTAARSRRSSSAPRRAPTERLETHAGAGGRRVRGRRHRGGAAPLPHGRGGRAPQRRRRAAGARGDRLLRGPAVRRDRHGRDRAAAGRAGGAPAARRRAAGARVRPARAAARPGDRPGTGARRCSATASRWRGGSATTRR